MPLLPAVRFGVNRPVNTRNYRTSGRIKSGVAIARRPACVAPALMSTVPLLRAAALCVALFSAFTFSRAADENPISPEEAARGYRTRTLLAKPRADLATVERAEAAGGVRLVRAHPRLGGLRTLETDGTDDVKDVIARLAASGLYEYVEPDFIRK